MHRRPHEPDYMYDIDAGLNMFLDEEIRARPSSLSLPRTRRHSYSYAPRVPHQVTYTGHIVHPTPMYYRPISSSNHLPRPQNPLHSVHATYIHPQPHHYTHYYSTPYISGHTAFHTTPIHPHSHSSTHYPTAHHSSHHHAAHHHSSAPPPKDIRNICDWHPTYRGTPARIDPRIPHHIVKKLTKKNIRDSVTLDFSLYTDLGVHSKGPVTDHAGRSVSWTIIFKGWLPTGSRPHQDTVHVCDYAVDRDCPGVFGKSHNFRNHFASRHSHRA